MSSIVGFCFSVSGILADDKGNAISGELVFNSTEYELSFDASGPSGTTEYAKIFISKGLVADISDLKVRVDATQIDFVTASTDASWVLYFSHVHSAHHVVIAIPAPTDGGLGYNGNPIYAVIVIYFLRRKPEVKS